jgi:hypothetical protein
MSTQPPTGGTFSPGELSTVSHRAPGVSGPNEASRFVQHCVDYYVGWYEHNGPLVLSGAIPQDQAALFLYAQVPDVSTGIPGLTTDRLTLAHRGAFTLSKGVYVCSETLSPSFRAPWSLTTDDELMNFALSQLRPDQTFVILHMARRVLYVHHAGVPLTAWAAAPSAVSVSVDYNAVDLAAVDKQLNIYHQDHTATHLGYTARLMWKTKKGVKPTLHHKPELHVQTSLLTHLKGFFRHANVIVQEEISNAGGRVDIQISRAEGGLTVKSTLELKVLRPDKNAQTNLDWGRKGITQAFGYINHETDFSMACLYDARLDKSDSMAALPPYAKQCDVQLRTFSMTPPTWDPAKKAATKGTSTPGKASKAAKATAKKAPAAKSTPASNRARTKASLKSPVPKPSGRKAAPTKTMVKPSKAGKQARAGKR